MAAPSIRQLERGEHDLIGRIIATGFADDTVNLWVFAGEGAMKPTFTTMAEYLYLTRGFGHVTADGLAGTLWLPPGAKKGYGLGNLSLGASIIRHGGLQALKNSLMIDAFMAKKRKLHPPHFYLFAIAVDPSLQGKGIGGALMREALTRVDAAGMPAYLENSKEQNISFYQNHGFEILEEAVPANGCPPMWLMWRKAN
ncbi:GNAT family N-acetyltransferase [Kordiimonas sp.]|uniref:GNAT family N-acetyltransferase n=1 Tax=Kordiimonas sp. TaxID=1970157 RepID=UPI003A8D120A